MEMGELMPGCEGGAQSSGAARFVRWALACALRFWPDESRAWGEALAAELEETSSTFEAVRWSLGGLMFFARSVLSSAWAWLKFPAGSSLPGGAASGPDGPSLVPKRSRIFTAALLAVTAALLMLPEGREALRTVTASWLGFVITSADDQLLEKLAVRAERDKDAATLAFVALSPARDATRAKEMRTSELVEQTVAVDPSYVWIYGAKNHLPDFYPVQKEWVERLQAADPDNAVPILMEANALVDQNLRSLSDHGYPTDKDFEKLGKNPEWMSLMARAYAAPKYDSYFAKHIQLMRHVWDRDPNLPPEIFLDSLWSHAIPNLYYLRLYAKIELNEAEKARAAGDFRQAHTQAKGVAAFGARMMDSSGAVIEELIAVAISRMADEELAKIYTSEGKTEEARRATAHAQELEQMVHDRYGHDEPGRAARGRTLHRYAALVQGAGILGAASLLILIVGILWLELWPAEKERRKTPWRRGVCFAANWAPVTLLVASATFLVGFLPFRRVFADFRASSFQLTDEQRVTDAVWGLVEVPQRLLGYDTAVAFWSALTVALSAAAVGIVACGIYRARRVQTQAIR